MNMYININYIYTLLFIVSMENYEKWKNFVNTVIKNPEELNITPLWKKEVINTTSSLWKCFINDLSAYEMVILYIHLNYYFFFLLFFYLNI